jgi:hypothetical protein
MDVRSSHYREEIPQSWYILNVPFQKERDMVHTRIERKHSCSVNSWAESILYNLICHNVMSSHFYACCGQIAVLMSFMP